MFDIPSLTYEKGVLAFYRESVAGEWPIVGETAVIVEARNEK